MPLASVTTRVTVLPGTALAVPVIVGVVSLVLSGASTVIANITVGSSGKTGTLGACNRFSKLKLCVLDRPMASKPDVSNCVDAMVSAPSRSMEALPVIDELWRPPAAGARSSSSAVGSAPSSNAAKICSISSVIGWALPSASTSCATGSGSCSGIKLLLFGSRIIAPSGTASPALMIAIFPFLSITSS
ncbi:hypothetical protein VCSRO34_2603 [Vibrio cholerae]|nr:hypothetical protein VCSRO34_2603 [Vibrio cholerae]GHZ99314.1 hypothetical protein VCSRO83_1418 [Vibrio cholerae]